MNLKYDEAVSSFPFNFNLHPYTKGQMSPQRLQSMGAGYKTGQSTVPIHAASRAEVTTLSRLLKVGGLVQVEPR